MFNNMLSLVIKAGIAPTKIAVEAGVGVDVVNRWMEGEQPDDKQERQHVYSVLSRLVAGSSAKIKQQILTILSMDSQVKLKEEEEELELETVVGDSIYLPSSVTAYVYRTDHIVDGPSVSLPPGTYGILIGKSRGLYLIKVIDDDSLFWVTDIRPYYSHQKTHGWF